MDGIDNARYDLVDAQCSLETAIELLGSIGTDEADQELARLVRELRGVHRELKASYQHLLNYDEQRHS